MWATSCESPSALMGDGHFFDGPDKICRLACDGGRYGTRDGISFLLGHRRYSSDLALRIKVLDRCKGRVTLRLWHLPNVFTLAARVR